MISQPEPAVSRLLPLDPIPAPMAWRDPDFAIERNWAFRLSPVDIAELGAALPPWRQAANASGSVRYRRPPLLSESQIRRTQSERMNGRALVEESDIAALDVHVQRDLLALRHRVEEIERLAPEGRPPLPPFSTPEVASSAMKVQCSRWSGSAVNTGIFSATLPGTGQCGRLA